ncbi:aldose 1-epimerase [Segetibacter koreensis]|uniref:aldose 1-epimerase n=1 Tax=Segetibacter koreensis TaxID=398037 RepID=UPI00037528F8|nr:aldose 1-epimerase [Segetibacter koreensis]
MLAQRSVETNESDKKLIKTLTNLNYAFMAFQTIISGRGDDRIITLKDLSNNTFAEIYAFGALLNNFSASGTQEELNVVEGFSSPQEAKEKITPFFRSAKLSPYACRIKNAKYKFGERNYQLKKYLSDNDAIHGVLFNADFLITEDYSDADTAFVVLEYVYNNIEEGFPFCYRCTVEYKLAAGNALTIKTTVSNIDNKLMPLVDGWHPYFTLGDNVNDYQLEFQSKEMLEFDETLVPTGKALPYQEFASLKSLGTTAFDNCFTLNFAECEPLCVLRNPKRKVQVEFYPSASYPYLQIFTPDHRKSIAIENLSAAPDAFNNGIGLKVLNPNESATFSTKFIIRFL